MSSFDKFLTKVFGSSNQRYLKTVQPTVAEINELEPALTHDVTGLLERLVDPAGPWRHDRPELSGCDRRNAASHLRALLLGPGVVIPVSAGRPALGRFQRIVFVELDGPRERTVRLTVLGTEEAS